MDEEVQSGRQPAGRSNVFAYAVSYADARDAEEVRRQPDAREPDEAGGQPPEAQDAAGCCRASRSDTSPTDYYPIQAVQLSRFKGETWELFGDVMAAEST
jgi:hypothetical protein